MNSELGSLGNIPICCLIRLTERKKLLYTTREHICITEPKNSSRNNSNSLKHSLINTSSDDDGDDDDKESGTREVEGVRNTVRGRLRRES